MGLISFLDEIFFSKDNQRERTLKEMSNYNFNEEYLHPDNKLNEEEIKDLKKRSDNELQVLKELREFEKKDHLFRDKKGSIVGMEYLPEIVKDAIVKNTGLPLDRLKEYKHGIMDWDFYLPGDERIFKIVRAGSSNNYREVAWYGEYLENKEGKPFLRIWERK